MSEPVPNSPRIRRAAIPEDAVLVVRGLASIEPETSIRQANLFRRRFPQWGRYGLSAFYARSDDEVSDLAEDRLVAFRTLFVYSLTQVRQAGFEIVPTYRTPHVTIAFYDEPSTAVARLLANHPPNHEQPSVPHAGDTMKIDLFVDLNTVDETGLPWTYADQAEDPSIIVVGHRLVVGAGDAIAIAEIVDINPDGLVHLRPLPGPVTPERLATITTNA